MKVKINKKIKKIILKKNEKLKKSYPSKVTIESEKFYERFNLL